MQGVNPVTIVIT